MRNKEIKEYIKSRNVPMWRVAERLGIADSSFSRMLRYEISEEKKYSNVQTDDAYWDVVVDESGQIAKKYDNHKFAIALLLAVIDELERIYKEMMKNADTTV